MWDLTKTLQALAGARKREAEGKPPFHSTPEEREHFAKTFAKISENLARRPVKDRPGPQ